MDIILSRVKGKKRCLILWKTPAGSQVTESLLQSYAFDEYKLLVKWVCLIVTISCPSSEGRCPPRTIFVVYQGMLVMV